MPKTIAFGGVPTGNLNAQIAASADGMSSVIGSMLTPRRRRRGSDDGGGGRGVARDLDQTEHDERDVAVSATSAQVLFFIAVTIFLAVLIFGVLSGTLVL